MKQLVAVAVLSLASFACTVHAQPVAPAPAPEAGQHVITTEELDLLRADIRSQKKQLIARNLKLSDDEATKFWPVYDEYAADLTKINDRKFALLQRYADSFEMSVSTASQSRSSTSASASVRVSKLSAYRCSSANLRSLIFVRSAANSS